MVFTLSILTTLLAVAFVAICLFMILVILIQKPKGGGLGSAFGGGGGGGSENAAFGAKTGDVLTWITVGCFVCFLLLAMGLTWTIRAEVSPDTTPPGQQATTGAPQTDDDAPDDAEEAVAGESGQVRQPQQTPVQPSPDLADPGEGEPDETITDEPLPEAPDQPEVPEEVEETLDQSNDEAESNDEASGGDESGEDASGNGA